MAEELTLLVIMYHMMCFTDWLPDLLLRHYIGYSITSCVLAHLFVFLAISFYQSARQRIRNSRRKSYIKNAKKHNQRSMKQTKLKLKVATAMLKERRENWANQQAIQDVLDAPLTDSR